MAVLLNANDLFIPEFSETATVNNVSAEVIASELSADIQLAAAGANLNIDASIIVRISVAAAEGQIVSFRGNSYRIAKIDTDSANITKRLYLEAQFGGA